MNTHLNAYRSQISRSDVRVYNHRNTVVCTSESAALSGEFLHDELRRFLGPNRRPARLSDAGQIRSRGGRLLKTLPKTKDYEYRKTLVGRPPTELNPGERSDVSWISTESMDRMGEVVLAKGMNDAQFQQNPLVTLGHAYWMPPVGKSLWRKRVKDGDLAGIKAKTQYPAAAGDVAGRRRMAAG